MVPLNYIYWRDGILYEDIFPATNQDKPICWAHAISAAIVLAYRRIIGRDEIKFEEVKKYLTNKYGDDKGKDTSQILPEVLRHYGLRCNEVKEEDVDLFNPNRSYHFYICRFRLTVHQWENFSRFFNDEKTKESVITLDDLNKIHKNENIDNSDGGGHAVILIDQDAYSLTFLNSWGVNWANKGKFSVSRDAIEAMNLKFLDVYWLTSDLKDYEKSCYETRRKKAIDAFYSIIDYTNLLSPIDETNCVINRVKTNQTEEIKKDTKHIFESFCKDYWKTGQSNEFCSQKLPSEITINDYNVLDLNDQINILNKIIKLRHGKNTDFLTKIKQVLDYFQMKNFITKSCIEIVNDVNIKMFDINSDLEVQFSSYVIESFYQQILLDSDDEMFKLIDHFDHFHLDLLYPHQSFQMSYDKILNLKKQFNLKFSIGIYVKAIETLFKNFNYKNSISFIRFDSNLNLFESNNFNYDSLRILIPSSINSLNTCTSFFYHMKRLSLKNWAKLIWSPEFRKIFSSKAEIHNLLGSNVDTFEELFIHIPLNYIYWRDGVKSGELFPATDQQNYPISWAHAIATCIVLSIKRIIGRNAPSFEDVKTDLLNKFGCKT